MSLYGDLSVDNKELGCAGRSLIHLEAIKTQSSHGEVEEPRWDKIWVGRGDPHPTTTTGLALPPIGRVSGQVAQPVVSSLVVAAALGLWFYRTYHS